MPHILIVEDDANARAALGELVGAEGFTTALAGSLRDARIQMSRHSPDAVLIDLVLPDGNGMDLMEDIAPHSGTEIIVMTGHASVETAVEALRMGAADYLVKPVNFQRLKSVLARIPRPGDLKAEIGNLRGELRRLGLFGQMLGNSTAMQTLYDQVSRVAPTEATVLLIGESGTGKELAAQTIHDLSLRRKQPFLPVNCGAISPNLIESEMFGHERGSFTGADRQHKGYFERANGGTLFLDEITEMPIELQVKLLRVLETGVFMRVGTNREIDSDVRVIAATNRDPKEAVADGKLRADLYHRLNVFPLQLPPLRSAARMLNCWPSISSISSTRRAIPRRDSCRRPWRPCAATTGRAMCASCATTCNARTSCQTTPASIRPTCRCKCRARRCRPVPRSRFRSARRWRALTRRSSSPRWSSAAV